MVSQKGVRACPQQTGMHDWTHASCLHTMLAWGLLGKEGMLLPGKCSRLFQTGYLIRFDVLVILAALEKSRFQSWGWLPNGATRYNRKAGQRAATYNAFLCEAGKTGRLVETKLKTKAGKKPGDCCKEHVQTPLQVLVKTCGLWIYPMLFNMFL